MKLGIYYRTSLALWGGVLYYNIPKTTSFFTLFFETFIDYDPAPALVVQTFASIGSNKHGESLVFFSCSTGWVRHVGRLELDGSGYVAIRIVVTVFVLRTIHNSFWVAAHQNVTTSPRTDLPLIPQIKRHRRTVMLMHIPLAVLLVVYHGNVVAFAGALGIAVLYRSGYVCM